MPQPKLRKLAAIVSADVAGYSHLMELDEAGTISRLSVCFDNVFSPRVDSRNGRFVKFMGDGVLLEFSSALDAVRCMLEIQNALKEWETDEETAHRMEFRMGINIGDITIIGDDIFGDGVIQAARLQEISEPGAICFSAAVYEQIKGKIEQTFHDLGHRKLKNIAEPVRVFSTGAKAIGENEEPSGWPFLSATTRKPVAAGGCLCGKIKYKVWSQPVTVGFCHCRHCQLALGAPLNAWAIFEKQNVTFEGDPPGLYASSQLSERAFCKTCGSSIYTDVKELGYYSIRVGTFDNPADFPPELHFGVESQIPWVDIHDDLPRIRTENDPQLSSRWVAVGESRAGPTLPDAKKRRMYDGQPRTK